MNNFSTIIVGLSTMQYSRAIKKGAGFLIGLAMIGSMSGCAVGSGILPAGPNTYTVTEQYGLIRGERVALKEADAFCRRKSLVFVPTLMGIAGNQFNINGPTDYSVTFRCLSPNDPAVAKFQLQQAPNVIVEQRGK